jgi:pimeloyl-ACP methyl ester carboxylesterase
MRFGPPVRFARRRDGRYLAYQVVGAGELDLVFLLGWPSHLGLLWEHPSVAGFLGRLSSFSRLILFDQLGMGLSDRGPTGHAFEEGMEDVRCVLAAVGSERAAFFGCHLGGRLGLLLAATYPDKVSAVVTFASHPATLRDQDYPWGATPEEREGLLAAIKAGTLDPAGILTTVAPREATDAATVAWWRMLFWSGASPAESYDQISAMGPVDIRRLLGSVQAPVLVLHRSGDRAADVRASRYLAQRLPNARMVELPGGDHFPFFGDQEAVVGLTQEFLTGALPVVDPDRVLATVVFTDLVELHQPGGGAGRPPLASPAGAAPGGGAAAAGAVPRPGGQDHRRRLPGDLRRPGPRHPRRGRHPCRAWGVGAGGAGGAAHRGVRAAG